MPRPAQNARDAESSRSTEPSSRSLPRRGALASGWRGLTPSSATPERAAAAPLRGARPRSSRLVSASGANVGRHRVRGKTALRKNPQAAGKRHAATAAPAGAGRHPVSSGHEHHRPRRRRLGPRAARRRRRRRRAPTACSPRPSGARPPSPQRTPGKVAELDGPGLAAAMDELAAISELVGRAGLLRARCASPRHRRPAPTARCCSASRSTAPRSRRRCCSSTSSGRRWTTSAPRSCWPPTAWTSAATTCAPRAATARTCSPSPRRRSWPRRRSPAATRGRGCSAS